MAQDVEVVQDKASNACCAAWKKKHAKLLEKYSKLEELKNKFRDCTALVQDKYDVIEKENENLKKELSEIKLQANVWKDEKEKESGRRIDLEDEVSALEDEVRLLKQNGNSASDEKLQERLIEAEKEIKQLKDLLDHERGRAVLEKKNAQSEKKKADEALKKVEMGKIKLSEAQKMATAEKKKAEENRVLLEKLKNETDDMKSMLALEKSKSEAAEKKAEAEKQKAIRERKRAELIVSKSEEQRKLAETNLKKATFENDRLDDLNQKLEEARNRADAAEKKVETENQNAIRERKRADLAVAKCKEQRELAETNLKKARLEKDRADDLNQKLEDARRRAVNLQEEMGKLKCSGTLVDGSNTGRNAELTSDVSLGIKKNDGRRSQWTKTLLMEKEHNFIREKKRADSEKKKAKKQRKVAEEYKKMAMEQKHRAEELSRELESYKLRFEELQIGMEEFVSCRLYASNASLRNNDIISETDSVKFLKKQLKLEKLLVKHAKKATKVEAVRNKMLHQELCHLKQECLQFQQRLDILDKSFSLGCEGIEQLGKIDNQTSTKETLCSAGHHRQLISGTDSRMDPPYGGSNQKILQSSAINSSSASFSDRPLVGSQERGTFSVMTSTNLEPKVARLSDMMRTRYNEHDVAKAVKSMRDPIKDSPNTRRVGYSQKKRILAAIESIEHLDYKSQKLHQQVAEKLSLLDSIFNSRKGEFEEVNLKETSCRELSRPRKKRKTCSEGAVVVHCLQKSGEPKIMLDSNTNRSDAGMPVSSPGSDVMKLDRPFKDDKNNAFGHNRGTQDFDEMIAYDYMKLLELDNSADEASYRRAISMPLSPLVPEIKFLGDEKREENNTEMLVCKSSQERLSNVKDNPVPLSSFHVIESESNYSNSVSNSIVPSQLEMGGYSADFPESMDLVSAGDTHFRQIRVSGGKLGMSDQSVSGSEESSILCENRTASTLGRHLKYFVVSSENKDKSNIVRILQTIHSSLAQCSFVHSVETFHQSILNTLLQAKDLSIKDKAYVFFTFILHEISKVGLTNDLSNNLVQSLGSVTAHIKSVMSNPVWRRLLLESCDLFELLVVIEDFLLHRKVLVYGDASVESELHSIGKLNFILDGNAVMLSEVAASAHLLVAGGSLLASLCSAADHIGFVCETSYNIIRVQKFNPAVMLAVFHSFAHICGSKYFTLQQYSLVMTLVKSLVIFLEKQILLTNSTSFIPSEIENSSKIWSCASCPFLEGAISMEDVAVLLLKNLQKQCSFVSCSRDLLALDSFLVSKVQSHDEGSEEVSGSQDAVTLRSTSDENPCDFVDVLSLVEVLASFMSWDWTSVHLIGPICEYLESRLMESSSAAIIILLGQLGRLGVEASGYENSGVMKLRGWLSVFVCENMFTKLGLSIQFGMVTSLFGLTPIKLEDVVEGKVEFPAVSTHSIPASFLKEWFSSLSCEQQLFLRHHQAN